MTCNKPIRPALNAISNKKIISATPVLFRQYMFDTMSQIECNYAIHTPYGWYTKI